MFEEFKKFAAAGNVVDLAVGVIVGGMFGKIVTAFVDDLIGLAIGPLFVVAELGFLIGLGKKTQAQVEAIAGPVRRRETANA